MIIGKNPVFALYQPSAPANGIPLVLDSPHSGTIYPMGSAIVAPPDALKTTWDAHVDELWKDVPAFGGTLLAARFPRAYIDPNRSPSDIDPGLIHGEWIGVLDPSERSKRGMGLIRRYALPGVPMYASPLPAAEIRSRIATYYEPYHAQLERLIEVACDRYGKCWHLNCHSMKSVGNAMNIDAGSSRPDFVVSDRAGKTSDPAFTQWVADELAGMGYRVSINSPYLGGYIVQKFGAPASGINSVQIEINRALYMNEATCETTDAFEILQSNLKRFLERLADYVRSQILSGQSNGELAAH